MTFPGRQQRGSTDKVYALLRRRIILGEYEPGARLKEIDLARELGISRTPIRAAFQRLEQDGLILSVPRQGVAVASWTDRDNDEVFDLRAHLESHAAALAATRRQDEHLAEMKQLNATMASLIRYRTENFRSDLEEVNRRFHQVIMRAAYSPRLANIVANLMNVNRVTGAFFYYEDEEFEKSFQDHVAITRAIMHENSNLARTLMDDHIRSTSKRLQSQRQNINAAAVDPW